MTSDFLGFQVGAASMLTMETVKDLVLTFSEYNPSEWLYLLTLRGTLTQCGPSSHATDIAALGFQLGTKFM